MGKIKGELLPCPRCNACIRIDGKVSRHERGLSYVPYGLYHKIERITGTSVKEQARRNLCR